MEETSAAACSGQSSIEFASSPPRRSELRPRRKIRAVARRLLDDAHRRQHDLVVPGPAHQLDADRQARAVAVGFERGLVHEVVRVRVGGLLAGGYAGDGHYGRWITQRRVQE